MYEKRIKIPLDNDRRKGILSYQHKVWHEKRHYSFNPDLSLFSRWPVNEEVRPG